MWLSESGGLADRGMLHCTVQACAQKNDPSSTQIHTRTTKLRKPPKKATTNLNLTLLCSITLLKSLKPSGGFDSEEPLQMTHGPVGQPLSGPPASGYGGFSENSSALRKSDHVGIGALKLRYGYTRRISKQAMKQDNMYI